MCQHCRANGSSGGAVVMRIFLISVSNIRESKHRGTGMLLISDQHLWRTRVGQLLSRLTRSLSRIWHSESSILWELLTKTCVCAIQSW